MPHSALFMDSLHSNYCSLVTLDRSLDCYANTRCGKAGTAILINKKLMFNVQRIQNIDNDRILGVEITSENKVPLYLFCIYMPADTDRSLYRESLRDVESLFEFYSKLGNIVLGAISMQKSVRALKMGTVKHLCYQMLSIVIA